LRLIALKQYFEDQNQNDYQINKFMDSKIQELNDKLALPIWVGGKDRIANNTRRN
jgi:hypothetical protein